MWHTTPSVGVGILSGGVWFLGPCTGPWEFRAGHFSGSWGIWQQFGGNLGQHILSPGKCKKGRSSLGYHVHAQTFQVLASPFLIMRLLPYFLKLRKTRAKILFYTLIRGCEISLFLGDFFCFSFICPSSGNALYNLLAF